MKMMLALVLSAAALSAHVPAPVTVASGNLPAGEREPVELRPVAMPAGVQPGETTALGRQCASDFHEGRHDELWARMTPLLQRAIGTRAGLTELQQVVARDAGTEKTVLREQEEQGQGTRSYLREAEFTRASARLTLRCTLDDEGRIAGFEVRPAQAAAVPAATTRLDYQTIARLRLPFEGEWYTVWGGRTVAQNYHAASSNQRFAYDVLKAVDGRTYAGDRASNESYHCWNQRILAPAAGTVTAARDGLPDNVPGVMDPANPPGNHVILDFGNGEFGVLAHLRHASIIVKAGDRVVAGQEVGRCGNSGNSSEPHLHFHLQTADTFGRGEGLPAFFNDYMADGALVERGEPLQGQTIRPK